MALSVLYIDLIFDKAFIPRQPDQGQIDIRRLPRKSDRGRAVEVQGWIAISDHTSTR